MDITSAIEIDGMDMMNSNQNMLHDTEDEEEDSGCMDDSNKEESDQELYRAQEQARILNDNMNRATTNLQLSSSDGEDALAPGEDSHGEDTEDKEDSSYKTANNPKATPNAHEINAEDYDDVQEGSLG
jgi:hypothetical protein